MKIKVQFESRANYETGYSAYSMIFESVAKVDVTEGRLQVFSHEGIVGEFIKWDHWFQIADTSKAA